MQTHIELGHGLPPVHRLGLATRGNTHLSVDDVEYALDRGFNYWNWCGRHDGMSEAIARLGARRSEVAIAVQFQAGGNLQQMLDSLGVDYIDVATIYYVESEPEWEAIVEPGGAWDQLEAHRREGRLRMIGLTTHQRKLGARWAKSGKLDMLMIRYNAAHRGAERDVFPVASQLRIPVVTFTALRWKGLLDSTRHDAPGFRAPSAAECYRFCLAHPNVAVTLSAPDNRVELDHALTLLDDWRAPSAEELDAMREHGNRVHRHAETFW